MSAISEITIGPCRLICGDCLDFLPGIEAQSVVTDPPYGIKQDKGMRGGGFDGFGNGVRRHPKEYAGEWDGERPPTEVFTALVGFEEAIVWGGNFFADLLPVNGKWLIWDKEQTMPSFSDAELAWTNLGGNSVKRFRYNGSGLMAKEKDRVHPTQKPVALMEWCLGFTKGQIVCDPFMGSGTTGIACIRTGRKFIGIEKDPAHFKTACDRIRRELAQPMLFEPAKLHEQPALI